MFFLQSAAFAICWAYVRIIRRRCHFPLGQPRAAAKVILQPRTHETLRSEVMALAVESSLFPGMASAADAQVQRGSMFRPLLSGCANSSRPRKFFSAGWSARRGRAGVVMGILAFSSLAICRRYARMIRRRRCRLLLASLSCCSEGCPSAADSRGVDIRGCGDDVTSSDGGSCGRGSGRCHARAASFIRARLPLRFPRCLR